MGIQEALELREVEDFSPACEVNDCSFDAKYAAVHDGKCLLLCCDEHTNTLRLVLMDCISHNDDAYCQICEVWFSPYDASIRPL